MARRGLTLEFDYERDVLDPFLMPDMAKAVERVWRAIEAGEQVAVFSDYDADGVPGAAIIHEFFKAVGFTNFSIYIPNRNTEDFGLNEKVVRELGARGVKLIITIDNGTSAVAETALAQQLGVDVIITDHHLAGAEMPPAFALLNPKYPPGAYPDEMLCGSAVLYKLIQGLVARRPEKFNKGWEKWLLDLVVIATITDMVPLVKENRALAHFGLRVIRQTRRLGLAALLGAAGLKREHLSEEDIGFVLGPRINAASRMAHASEAYFLLTSTDASEAATLAGNLEEHNKSRKRAVDQILAAVKAEYGPPGPATPGVIVAGDGEVPSGVLGLAASKLVEHYGRPVVLWAEQGEQAKGSCRSDGSVSMVELMTAADAAVRQAGGELFTRFGGHHAAAGFSLPKTRVDELKTQLLAAYERLPKKPTVTSLVIDAELGLDEINEETFAKVEQLAPFGMGNPRPVFLLAGVTLTDVRRFGNGQPHLELSFCKTNGHKVCAVGFFSGASYDELELQAGLKIDLAATLEKSYFKNYPELRLRIVDVRLAQ